jgi:hypothetical protein
VELDALRGDFVFEVGGEVLGHGGHGRVALTVIVQVYALVDECTAHSNAGLHFGQSMLKRKKTEVKRLPCPINYNAMQ